MKVIKTKELNDILEQHGLSINRLRDMSRIILYHPSEYDGGFDVFDLKIDEVSSFYSDFEEMLEAFDLVIKSLGVEYLILGKFIEGRWLHAWSNAKEYELYRILERILKEFKLRKDSSSGIMINLKEDYSLIRIILEADFRYFGHIGFLCPEYSLLIYPTHHFDFQFYSPEHDKMLSIVNRALIKNPKLLIVEE